MEAGNQRGLEMRITLDYGRPTPSHCTVAVFIDGALAGELVLRQSEVVAFQIAAAWLFDSDGPIARESGQGGRVSDDV